MSLGSIIGFIGFGEIMLLFAFVIVMFNAINITNQRTYSRWRAMCLNAAHTAFPFIFVLLGLLLDVPRSESVVLLTLSLGYASYFMVYPYFYRLHSKLYALPKQ